MDSSPPGSPVHGILQARALEWGAISFSDFKTTAFIFLHFHMVLWGGERGRVEIVALKIWLKNPCDSPALLGPQGSPFLNLYLFEAEFYLLSYKYTTLYNILNA